MNRREMIGAVAGLAGAAGMPSVGTALAATYVSRECHCFAGVRGWWIHCQNSIKKRGTEYELTLEDGRNVKVSKETFDRFQWLIKNRCFMQNQFFHSV